MSFGDRRQSGSRRTHSTYQMLLEALRVAGSKFTRDMSQPPTSYRGGVSFPAKTITHIYTTSQTDKVKDYCHMLKSTWGLCDLAFKREDDNSTQGDVAQETVGTLVSTTWNNCRCNLSGAHKYMYVHTHTNADEQPINRPNTSASFPELSSTPTHNSFSSS